MIPARKKVAPSQRAPLARVQGFRALCFACAAMLPSFWLAYHHALPDAIDPLGVRLALAALLLAVGGSTYLVRWTRRWFVAIGGALPYGFYAWWLGAVVYVNGFAPDYAIGTLLVFVAAGLALGVVTDRPAAFVAFSAFVVLTTSVAAAWAEEPGVNPPVLVLCLGGVALVMGVVQQARARAMAELRRAKRQAEEVARLKSAFLANMSHEIRTPLTAILGFADVLGQEVTDPQHQEFVELIARGGRRLMDTLTSVLDLARLQSGGMTLTLGPVDVAEVARDAVEALRPLARAKGLALAAHVPTGVYARADRAALQRVLLNLLSNAVKFTTEGRVVLAIDAAGPAVRLRVSDTGRGIGPAFLPRLFDEFRQESTGHARSHEGSGLGLAITKGLVDLMGGAIAVESVPGIGSTFTVTLVAAAGPPADVTAPSRRAVPLGGDGAQQPADFAHTEGVGASGLAIANSGVPKRSSGPSPVRTNPTRS
ncbi:MAG TPA: HAMP domain-containing sensor histidine kinase [Rubricoccaceae bacterium]|nr:HAMP domain-containing sensor histidine kinase [Rubricoccaceae bacterium]